MSHTQPSEAQPSAAVFGPVTGDMYERQMGRWSRHLAEQILDFVDIDLGGGAALDVGCGTGRLSFAVAQRNPAASVTGCAKIACTQSSVLGSRLGSGKFCTLVAT